MLSERGDRSPACSALYSSTICRKIGSAIISSPGDLLQRLAVMPRRVLT
jgi:hypothetical protein